MRPITGKILKVYRRIDDASLFEYNFSSLNERTRFCQYIKVGMD